MSVNNLSKVAAAGIENRDLQSQVQRNNHYATTLRHNVTE